MGFVKKAIVGGMIFLGGMYAGNQTAQDPVYSINRNEQQVVLQANNVNKSYELTRAGNDVYMGDSMHNLKGVQAMALEEGKRIIKPQVDSLETKIQSRKKFDRFEKFTDDLKDAYMDFKHNTLE